MNCTVYVLEEALLPLRLPLCSCSVQLLQSDIVTTVVVVVAAAAEAALAAPAPAPAAPAAANGDVGGVPPVAAAANAKVSPVLLEGGVTDKGICKVCMYIGEELGECHVRARVGKEVM